MTQRRLDFLGIITPGEAPPMGAIGTYRDGAGSWWLWLQFEAVGPFESQAQAEDALISPLSFRDGDKLVAGTVLEFAILFLLVIGIPAAVVIWHISMHGGLK